MVFNKYVFTYCCSGWEGMASCTHVTEVRAGRATACSTAKVWWDLQHQGGLRCPRTGSRGRKEKWPEMRRERKPGTGFLHGFEYYKFFRISSYWSGETIDFQAGELFCLKGLGRPIWPRHTDSWRHCSQWKCGRERLRAEKRQRNIVKKKPVWSRKKWKLEAADVLVSKTKSQ